MEVVADLKGVGKRSALFLCLYAKLVLANNNNTNLEKKTMKSNEKTFCGILLKTKYSSCLITTTILLLLIGSIISSCHGHHPRDISNAGDSINYDTMAPIKFKFFLERSGSMIPYDARTTSGDFKAAISKLLNNIPDNNDPSNMFYVVNDAVYLYNSSYKDFIQSKDIFADTNNMGDPRYTDFTCIFDSLLSHTGENELSILVSDLIYSTKDMANVSNEKILNEANALTRSVFKGHADKMVLIIKMNADFDGTYYTFQSPSKGIKYHGNRPYYFVIVANPTVIHRIFLDPQYKDFINFASLQGYENYYCFSKTDQQVDYSVLLTNPRNQGRIGAVKGQTLIHEIEKIKPDRDGIVTITIALDLSKIIVPDSILLNKNNYDISSLSGFNIKTIEKIPDSERDDKLRFIPNATHYITLSTNNNISYETTSISLKNKLPQWVEKSNCDDDTNLDDRYFKETTFAFKYLMKGIYEAYYGTTDVPSFFSIELTINK